MRVKVAVAGVHGEERAPVRQGMVAQVGQGPMQLLLEQGGTFVRGGGWFLAYTPVQGVGADGVAPFAVEGDAGTVVLCTIRQKEGETVVLL